MVASTCLGDIFPPVTGGHGTGTQGDLLSKSSKSKADACVEHGIWTPLPEQTIPAVTNVVITAKNASAMTFHMVGCSGDPRLEGRIGN